MAFQTVAKTRLALSEHFRCRHCKLEANATVLATGYGQQRGLGSDLAAARAAGDAAAVAARSLQFVPCPRCGKTDPRGKSFRLKVTFGSLAVGLFVAATVLVCLYAAADSDFSLTGHLTLAAILGAAFTAACYVSWGRAWRGAAKRVELEVLPPAPWEVSGRERS